MSAILGLILAAQDKNAFLAEPNFCRLPGETLIKWHACWCGALWPWDMLPKAGPAGPGKESLGHPSGQSLEGLFQSASYFSVEAEVSGNPSPCKSGAQRLGSLPLRK